MNFLLRKAANKTKHKHPAAPPTPRFAPGSLAGRSNLSYGPNKPTVMPTVEARPLRLPLGDGNAVAARNGASVRCWARVRPSIRFDDGSPTVSRMRGWREGHMIARM